VNRRSPIAAHYATGSEKDRLNSGPGRLERIRTQGIIERVLPPAPADVVDVGGGPGGYAVWLASRGYNVDLLDLVPLHVEQAREAFKTSGLIEDDRLRALREAWRVLRPSGRVTVAGISRFASLLDGFFRGFIADPSLVDIVKADLESGRHENPARHRTEARFQPGACGIGAKLTLRSHSDGF